MFKLLKWIFLLVVLVVVLVFVVVPLLANTEAGRKQVATVIGDALHRNVRLGGLDVGLFFSSLKIRDLAVDNPEGFPATPFVKAGSLQMDVAKKELLDRKVVGSVKGSGLQLHIVKKGGVTNLDGLGGAKKPSEEGGGGTPGGGEGGKPGEKAPGEPSAKAPAVDLHVTLDIDDSRLTIEDLDKKETLTVDGVSLSMVMSNRKGVTDANLKIRIRSIDQKELRLRDIELDAKQSGDWLDIPNLRAKLASAGTLEGSGRLQLRGGDAWNGKFDAKNVQLDREILPVVAGMFPFAAKAEESVAGAFDASFDVNGHGLTWEAMKPTLLGTGNLALRGLKLGGGSLLGQVLGAAGIAGGDLEFKDAGAEFRVKEGWLDFNRLSASGAKARYDLAGRVSLDGQLDLKMDLLPLVKQFGGNFKEAEKYVTEIPVPIEGTTSAPRFSMPDPKSLLTWAAKNLLEEKAGGLLDKIRPK